MRTTASGARPGSSRSCGRRIWPSSPGPGPRTWLRAEGASGIALKREVGPALRGELFKGAIGFYFLVQAVEAWAGEKNRYPRCSDHLVERPGFRSLHPGRLAPHRPCRLQRCRKRWRPDRGVQLRSAGERRRAAAPTDQGFVLCATGFWRRGSRGARLHPGAQLQRDLEEALLLPPA